MWLPSVIFRAVRYPQSQAMKRFSFKSSLHVADSNPLESPYRSSQNNGSFVNVDKNVAKYIFRTWFDFYSCLLFGIVSRIVSHLHEQPLLRMFGWHIAPKHSMHGIFICSWLQFIGNVGKYTIHWVFGAVSTVILRQYGKDTILSMSIKSHQGSPMVIGKPQSSSENLGILSS